MTIQTQIVQFEKEFNTRVGQAQEVKRRRDEVAEEIDSLSNDVELYEKVLSIFHSVSSDTQSKFTDMVESLVSEGLSSVFDEEIKFRIDSQVKAGQVTMDFRLEDSEGNSTALIDARGGGLVSLCGLILRILVVRLMNSKVAQVLILDEALAMLSAEYRPAAAELLQRLSIDLGIQLILVTHHSEFMDYADTVFRLRKDINGVVVEKI